MLKVATSPKASMRQRIEAERLAAHCAVAALQVTCAGPLMMRRLVRNLDISHFNEPFSAEEADIEIRRLELNRVVKFAGYFAS
jgi:hypothetical protein